MSVRLLSVKPFVGAGASLLGGLAVDALLVDTKSMSVLSGTTIALLISSCVGIATVGNRRIRRDPFRTLAGRFALRPNRRTVATGCSHLCGLPHSRRSCLHSNGIDIATRLTSGRACHLAVPGRPRGCRTTGSCIGRPALTVRRSSTVVTDRRNITGNGSNLFTKLNGTVNNMFNNNNSTRLRGRHTVTTLGRPATDARGGANDVSSGACAITPMKADGRDAGALSDFVRL